MKPFFPVAGLLLLAACTLEQSTAYSAAPPTEAATAAPADTTGPMVSAEQAAALASRYFRAQPDSGVYLLPTLKVMDAGPQWQVLVKRSDRVGIMPDNSAIHIDKQTGAVSPVLTK